MTRIFILLLLSISSFTLQAQDLLRARILLLNKKPIVADIMTWTKDHIEIQSSPGNSKQTLYKKDILTIELLNKGPQVFKDNTIVNMKSPGRITTFTDTVKGNLIQYDKESITLDTNFAGKLTIPRSNILDISLGTQSNYVYSGPNNKEEWQNPTVSKDWSYSNNALHLGTENIILTNNIDLPDKVMISFDYQTNKSSAYLSFFTTTPELADSPNCYRLTMRQNLFDYKKKSDSKDLILQQIKPSKFVSNRRNSDITNNKIYIDTIKGITHLFQNNSHVATYEEKGLKPSKLGSSFNIISPHRTELQIKNIQINSWSGYDPRPINKSQFSELEGSGQKISLQNGDRLIAETGSMSKGLLDIKSTFGPLKLATAGISKIDLSSTSKYFSNIKTGDIKLHFKHGGSIIVTPISISGSKLRASHQAFDEKEFDINSLNKIDFNINSSKHNTARKTTW